MTETLRTRVFDAGIWTMSSHMTTQFLRFAGNLILTRLLFPEAFGLMAIIQVLLTGLTLLSDIGIRPSIIQNSLGHTKQFLDTAWSIQIIRGFIIYAVVLSLSIPMANFYDEPLLKQLLPVVGITAIINGFLSTHIALANRDLLLKKIAILEIASYTVGLTATITLAWMQGSVWSLVWGALISAAVKTIASHFLYSDKSNQFAWNPDALSELISFGRWVLVSSILTFFAGQGSRLIVGKLIGMEYMAYFMLAMGINLMLPDFMKKIGGNVLFPAYSQIEREDSRRLYSVLLKSRLIMIVPVWLVAVLFVYFGEELIAILYDSRYKNAGWMLQYLSSGVILDVLVLSYGGVLWAKGMAATNAALMGIQIVIQFSSMLIGYHLAGVQGLVLSFPFTICIMYCVNAYVYSRLKLWQPKVDITIIGVSILVIYVAIVE